MRARLRTWPIVVYRYGVQIQDPANPAQRLNEQRLPPAILQEADRMQALWNQLCEAFAKQQEAYRQLVGSSSAVQRVTEQLHQASAALSEARTALKQARQRLRTKRHADLQPSEDAVVRAQRAKSQLLNELNEARRISKRTHSAELRTLREHFTVTVARLARTCPIDWSNREYVKEKFRRAMRHILATGGGPPRPNVSEPKTFHFHYHFGGGGIPVVSCTFASEAGGDAPARWILGRSRRVNIRAIPSTAFDEDLPKGQRKSLIRTQGLFRIAGLTLPLTVYLHRPLPTGSFVKNATLFGRQIHGPGYRRRGPVGEATTARWEWALLLSVEAPPSDSAHTPRPERIGALDVGYRLVGKKQLRLGVLGDSDGHIEELRLPEKILQAFRHKQALQTQKDTLLEQTKEQLRHLTWPEPLPPQAAAIRQQLTSIRFTGLSTLLRLLETHHLAGPVLELLQSWADQTTRLVRERRGLETRYLRHREWYYRNLALHICRQYSTLVIEILDLKSIASDDNPPDPMLDQAAKYRRLVAPSSFLSCLEHAATKTGTRIVRVPAAYSTRTCSVCQAVLRETGPDLILQCPKGHLWDQDENAVRNLLRLGQEQLAHAS
jgi:hypothetical protein